MHKYFYSFIQKKFTPDILTITHPNKSYCSSAYLWEAGWFDVAVHVHITFTVPQESRMLRSYTVKRLLGNYIHLFLITSRGTKLGPAEQNSIGQWKNLTMIDEFQILFHNTPISVNYHIEGHWNDTVEDFSDGSV